MAEKTQKTHGKASPVSTKTATKTKGAEKSSPSKVLSRAHGEESGGIPLPEDRYRMVAEAAYFIAESRGFANGRCEEDWYEAERLAGNNWKAE